MRVLVTNDDGVTTPGLAALTRAAVAAEFDVVVAAPRHDQSGVGTAISPAAAVEGVGVTPVELDGAVGVPAHAVDGPPALAVLTARLGGLGPPPDLVASGVNNGPNTGFAVLHSGTVGAALTAANFGASGLAVSIDSGVPRHLETAEAVASAGLLWLAGAPPRTVLNVNVPDRAVGDLAGVRVAGLASFGQVQATVDEVGEGRLAISMSAGGLAAEPGTDTALLAAGFVTVTSLVGVSAVDEGGASGVIEKVLMRASRAGP
ncbi:MAG TPA: 5'/3'-nucleotidase SurE [Acidimicrobiales bacterium]|nr:5'/3'-nucleotidase SurE [Acidimicrobiales bacterium]